MKHIGKIGYVKFRRFFFQFICYISCHKNEYFSLKLNAMCRFNGREIFGSNSNFNGCRVYGKGIIRFGSNFHSAKNLIFLTTYHNYLGEKLPYDETNIVKDIEIGDNVWVGMNVIILGGVTIGEGAIIQAGSVVSRSVPPLAIAGGNPAVPFKFRQEDKYLELKKKELFL